MGLHASIKGFMEKQGTAGIFIDILKCHLTGESLKNEHLDLLKSNDATLVLNKIYAISCKHDLAHIVAD